MKHTLKTNWQQPQMEHQFCPCKLPSGSQPFFQALIPFVADYLCPPKVIFVHIQFFVASY